MQTYYESLGLAQDKVNNLQSIQSVVMVVADLPGGYLADRFGVRRMMVLSMMLLTINSVYFAQCQTYAEFSVSLVASGIAWALLAAIEEPIRRTYLNGLIASEQRATVLSFDALIGSAGGVVIQPALGRVADIGGYGASFVVAGAIQALALPFLFLARRERAHSDPTAIEEPSATVS